MVQYINSGKKLVNDSLIPWGRWSIYVSADQVIIGSVNGLPPVPILYVCQSYIYMYKLIKAKWRIYASVKLPALVIMACRRQAII